MGFVWTCPYCNSKTTIKGDNLRISKYDMTLNNADGIKQFTTKWIICPNDECNKFTLTAFLHNLVESSVIGYYEQKELLNTWNLIPGSYARVYPNYIPEALIKDYQEACLIRDLSPKASATLSRRCIQGIIRDFWKITKSRLIDEISELEDKIDSLTWKAIDAVRKVGNIGAHMEKDIDLIIEVDPKEAELLINLIELLFEEWYIKKRERELKLKSIVKIAQNKTDQKKGKTS
ncbi:MAG: DUF4145 domain-containing protein [Candidatus Tenebribacter davisii]|jgi:hypothetical protein|nr:DUF4145 domain-containing protein [Candidatus Tenebribacter davisii]